MLSSFSASSVLTKDERAALEAKLEKCRDPSTIDLVKAHAAKQRGEGADEEAKAAKKKLQREQSMRDADPFGPSIAAR
jgi:cyclin H